MLPRLKLDLREGFYRALKLLKNGGYFGFIIPNSILYNESYSKIRDRLLQSTSLKKIVRLPDNVFKDAKVETIILIFQKGNPHKNICEVLIYDRLANINSITIETCKQHVLFNQDTWNEGQKTINITLNKSFSELLKKIEMTTVPLVELCDFSLGLTPYDKYKGHTQKQIEERVFHSSTKKNETFKPLLSGENIVRYGIFWDKKEYISYGSWLGAAREKRFFTEPRIVVRQIISGKPLRIYAGYSEDELYNAQIGFNLLPKDKAQIQIKYVLAILISKLMTFYHRERYLDPSKNLFQKILIANAKRFPIKLAPSSEQQKVVNLVDKLLALKKRLFDLGDKQTEESAKLEKEIAELDRKIDELVFDLYGLTAEERKIVEKAMK